MLRMFRSLWIWTATVTLVIVWCPLLALVWVTDRDPLRLRTARWFRRLGRAVARVHPWRVHISGREYLNSNPVYVVVSNHQSLADIPLITLLHLDAKWLAKSELFRTPLIGWMLRMARDIPVERGDRRKGAQSLLQAARILRQGCSLVFFPEGTRSPDGEVQSFNEAPFQLAARERVAVLPLAVDGSGAALPKHTWMFDGTRDIHLHVLPPVTAAGRKGAELCDLVRRQIAEEVARIRRGGQA